MRDHSILSYYAESNYLDIIKHLTYQKLSVQQLTFLFRIMWIVPLMIFDLEVGERILLVTFQWICI